MYLALPGKTPTLTRKRCNRVADMYARHPMWREVLALIFRHVDGNDREATARAAWRFVRHNITFHKELGEQIQTPATTLRRRIGDCDDQYTLMRALLRALGFEVRGALLRRDGGELHVDVGPRRPGRAFHIWPQVLIDGRWVDADTVHPAVPFGTSPADALRTGITIQ